MEITSPVTGKENVQLEMQLDAKRIAAGYRNELGYDVAPFFRDAETIKLYRCTETGYRFFLPSTLAGDESLYRHLEQYDWYYARWKWENDFVMGLVKKGQRLLDIGCGDGSFIHGLVQNGIRAEGLELNRSAAEKAKAKGLTIHVQRSEEFVQSHREAFDVVCAMQVLEHIHDVRSFVKTARELVKPGGLLMIAVPNNNPFLYRYDVYHWLNLPPHHMGMWDKSSLEKASPFYDLKCEQVAVEPLQKNERYQYFLCAAEHRNPGKANRTSVRLRALWSRISGEKIDGRNLVAVYRKPPSA